MQTNLEKIIKYNKDKTLNLVKQAFEVINNPLIILTADQLKILYKGFYSGYRVLMSDQEISKEEKIDLAAKKRIIDDQLKLNEQHKKIIKNTPLNELNVFKSVANRIQTENL